MINVKTNGKNTNVTISGSYTELTNEIAELLIKWLSNKKYMLCYSRALDVVYKENTVYTDTDSIKKELNNKYGRMAQQNEDNKN